MKREMTCDIIMKTSFDWIQQTQRLTNTLYMFLDPIQSSGFFKRMLTRLKNFHPKRCCSLQSFHFQCQFFNCKRSCTQLAISIYENKKEVNMANMKRNNGNSNLATTRSLTPFGGLVDGVLQNTLSRFFDDDLWGFSAVNSQVPVNIRETDKTYEMEVIAPGLKKEDFNVSMDNNLLTVSFEHKEEDKQENKRDGYLRQEYRMQSFSRSYTLDDTVDADHITAQYKDGVLHVSLPKKEGAQRITKNIQVK
jgi:HSP20 family protein